MKTIILFFLVSLSAINAQWKQCNGPFGASIKDIEVFENNLYIGTEANGIFISSDNGDNWQTYNNGLSQLSVECISNIDNNLYISLAGSGVYRLVGNKWKLANQGLNFSNISTIVGTGDTLFAGDYFNHNLGISIAYSTDGGLNWADMPISEDYNLRYIQDMLYYDNKLWVQSNNSLSYTSDLGANWYLTEEIYPDLKKIAKMKVIEDNIFIADQSKLFFTSNRGEVWEELFALDNDYIRSMEADKEFIYLGTKEGKLFLINHLNNSVVEPAKDLNFSQIRAIKINNGILYIGENAAGGRILMSEDKGNNFVERINGITGYINVTDMDSQYNSVFASEKNKIYKSDDNGNNWVNIFSLSDEQLITDIDVSEKLHFITDTMIYMSDTKYSNIIELTNIPNYSNEISAISSSNDTIVVATDTGVYTSVDDGNTWIEKNNGLPSLVQKNNIKYSNGKIYLGTESLGMFISDDFGLTWINEVKGLDDENIIAFDLISNYYFAGTNYGMYRKKTEDVQWLLSGELYGSIHDIRVDGDYIFTSTDNGVYYSNDFGNSWTNITDNLPFYVNHITTNNMHIFASTLRNGIYFVEKEFYGITSIKSVVANHCCFSISPNPASDYIEISLSDNHSVNSVVQNDEIAIYDVLGNVVEQTSSSVHSGGTPELLRIDISNLPRGLYYVRIGKRVEKFVKK